MVDNTMYDADYLDLQDTQQAQVAACRAFYEEFEPLMVVDFDDVYKEERTEIVVDGDNLKAIAKFLRDGKTWLVFKPAVVEDERGLVVSF